MIINLNVGEGISVNTIAYVLFYINLNEKSH